MIDCSFILSLKLLTPKTDYPPLYLLCMKLLLNVCFVWKMFFPVITACFKTLRNIARVSWLTVILCMDVHLQWNFNVLIIAHMKFNGVYSFILQTCGSVAERKSQFHCTVMASYRFSIKIPYFRMRLSVAAFPHRNRIKFSTWVQNSSTNKACIWPGLENNVR